MTQGITHDEFDALREGWDFEAKLASGRDGRGTVPKSMWETYSAMANGTGGRILLGAKERGNGSLKVVGLADIAQVERDLFNQLENRQKVSVNLIGRDDVQRLMLDGCSLLLLTIRRADRADRPVHLNGSLQRAFIRVNEGDHLLSFKRVRRMHADAIPGRDASTLANYTLADLHEESVRRYRESFAARRPDHAFLAKNKQEFLIAVGAAGRDRQGGSTVVRPTWAGLWMLGEELAIRELNPHWHLSFKELPDDPDDSRRWLDRIYPDGDWNANLFQFYLRVISKLQDNLRVPFRLSQGQFRVDDSAVHQAVREALVNALVHADQQGTTGIRVIKRRSGFEFVNPGMLLVTAAQLWRGGVSEARNPSLQRLFGHLQLGEREGSGGPTMRRVWRSQHWRLPRASEDIAHGETHLLLPMESLLPDWAVSALMQRRGTAFTNQDELGHVILVTAEVEGSVNHGRISELSEVHSRDITLKLQDLVRRKLLVSSGRSKGTSYAPARVATLPLFAMGGTAAGRAGVDGGPTGDASEPRLGASGTSSQRTSVDGEQNGANTGISRASGTVAGVVSRLASKASDTGVGLSRVSDTGVGLSGTSLFVSGTSEATTTNEPFSTHGPLTGMAVTDAIRSVRASHRSRPPVLKQAILDACTNRWLRMAEIADAIGRSTNAIRARYVAVLVAEGRLDREHPKATSAKQRYRTVALTPEPSGAQLS